MESQPVAPRHLLAGVRTRRQLLGIRAVDLAKRIAVTPTSYMRFERGERRIYLDKAVAIAKMLNCSLDELAIEPTLEQQVEMFRALKLRETDPDVQWGEAMKRAMQNDEVNKAKPGDDTVVLQNDVNETDEDDDYVNVMIHGE